MSGDRGDCDFIARRYTRFIAQQIIVRDRLTELLVQRFAGERGVAGVENKYMAIRLSRDMIYDPRLAFAFR